MQILLLLYSESYRESGVLKEGVEVMRESEVRDGVGCMSCIRCGYSVHLLQYSAGYFEHVDHVRIL